MATLEIPYHMWPHQRRFHYSEAFVNALVTGYGGGKTYAGVQQCIKLSVMNGGLPGMYVSPSYRMGRRTIVPTFHEVLDSAGLRYKRDYIFNKNEHEFRIRPWNGLIWIGSGDDPDALRGPNLAWGGIDEPFIQKREVYEQMLARVRHPRARFRQLFLTGTPEQLNWGYEILIEDPAPDTMLTQGSALLNRTLPLRFFKNLLARYPLRMVQAYIGGKFVNLKTNRIYYEFDREDHLEEKLELNPALPLLWSHDFNVDPLSSVICQKYKDELYALDEIILHTASIRDAIEEFRARGYDKWMKQGGAGVTIYGDATGAHRDTRSKSSDYGILRDHGFMNQKVRKANPPIRHRHNSVNGRLRNALGEIHLQIHPRCKYLARGLDLVGYRPNSYLEEDLEEQHVTAALSYLVEREWPFRKYEDAEETRRWR